MSSPALIDMGLVSHSLGGRRRWGHSSSERSRSRRPWRRGPRRSRSSASSRREARHAGAVPLPPGSQGGVRSRLPDARAIYNKLLAEAPADPALRPGLALCEGGLGRVFLATGRSAEGRRPTVVDRPPGVLAGRRADPRRVARGAVRDARPRLRPPTRPGEPRPAPRGIRTLRGPARVPGGRALR